MNPKEWKILKEELLKRSLSVKVIGREKKEYLATNSEVAFDILRGGITHTSSFIEVFEFTADLENILLSTEVRSTKEVLKLIDNILADNEQFIGGLEKDE